ncbi:hypothetical protein [Massilia atriviolacea]|uniref:hypothetical protein n=1 Tax=Massilia atriviolacea TaxID=2495579 RepID=UPI0018E09F29|nr:hypothetical protein [Massilia atriviolacea]
MSAETITVYIDPTQLTNQQNNNYSLYLAKMVNGQYTVIWQSLGPIATASSPSYEYENNFQISVPSYQVNYGTVTEVDGSVTFSAGGKPVTMNLGQTVSLSSGGEFSSPANGGTAGTLTVNNSLARNPHEILSDMAGNTIFVNTASGMDIGQAVLTPIDQYQLWFGNLQDTGTIIANNVSNAGVVTFSGSSTEVISYTEAGAWESGPLASRDLILDPAIRAASNVVVYAATFTTALTVVAVTFLLNELIGKFETLRPTSITAQSGSKKLTLTFSQSRSQFSAVSPAAYDAAINKALTKLSQAKDSPIARNAWKLNGPEVRVNFD